MAFRWTFEDAAGATVDGPNAVFDSQDEAEGWLGDHWAELLDVGVHQVTLMDGDRRVYGPMSLHPPQP